MIRIIPIDFMGQGAMLEPRDRVLHDMAVDYCQRELEKGNEVDLSKFSKTWVVMEMEGEFYKSVQGIFSWVNRVDIPLFRSTSIEATKLIAERINSFFADNGCRGQELFVHISKRERESQRCPAWKEVMVEWGAESAERFSFKVR